MLFYTIVMFVSFVLLESMNFVFNKNFNNLFVFIWVFIWYGFVFNSGWVVFITDLTYYDPYFLEFNDYLNLIVEFNNLPKIVLFNDFN